MDSKWLPGEPCSSKHTHTQTGQTMLCAVVHDICCPPPGWSTNTLHPNSPGNQAAAAAAAPSCACPAKLPSAKVTSPQHSLLHSHRCCRRHCCWCWSQTPLPPLAAAGCAAAAAAPFCGSPWRLPSAVAASQQHLQRLLRHPQLAGQQRQMQLRWNLPHTHCCCCCWNCHDASSPASLGTAPRAAAAPAAAAGSHCRYCCCCYCGPPFLRDPTQCQLLLHSAAAWPVQNANRHPLMLQLPAVSAQLPGGSQLLPSAVLLRRCHLWRLRLAHNRVEAAAAVLHRCPAVDLLQQCTSSIHVRYIHRVDIQAMCSKQACTNTCGVKLVCSCNAHMQSAYVSS